MGRSRMSYRHGRSQSRGSSDHELRKTKVIGGHAMAIRDLNIGLLKEHKLESHGKLPTSWLTGYRNRPQGVWTGRQHGLGGLNMEKQRKRLVQC